MALSLAAHDIAVTKNSLYILFPKRIVSLHAPFVSKGGTIPVPKYLVPVPLPVLV